MSKKRTLTHERRAVRSYWEYVLGLCEELLLDVGNLAGKRGLAADVVQEDQIPTPGAADEPDPGECQRFREKWSPLFLASHETDNYELLELRNLVRRAFIHGEPQDLQILAIEMANRPAQTRRPDQTYRHLQYLDFFLLDGSSLKELMVVPRPMSFAPDSMLPAELDWKPQMPYGPTWKGPKSFDFARPVKLSSLLSQNIWKAPILFDFPRALAAAVLGFTGKGRKPVCCRQCGRFVRGRSNQRFCPGGKCRVTWHRFQPAYREKWRAYMKEKMREYRALEKRRNHINQKLSRGKHAKAT